MRPDNLSQWRALVARLRSRFASDPQSFLVWGSVFFVVLLFLALSAKRGPWLDPGEPLPPQTPSAPFSSPVDLANQRVVIIADEVARGEQNEGQRLLRYGDLGCISFDGGHDRAGRGMVCWHRARLPARLEKLIFAEEKFTPGSLSTFHEIAIDPEGSLLRSYPHLDLVCLMLASEVATCWSSGQLPPEYRRYFSKD